MANPCRIELNATFIASQDPERWGYSNGTIQCPYRNKCKCEDSCVWKNQRTIGILQDVGDTHFSQTEKFKARQIARDQLLWGGKLAM